MRRTGWTAVALLCTAVAVVLAAGCSDRSRRTVRPTPSPRSTLGIPTYAPVPTPAPPTATAAAPTTPARPVPCASGPSGADVIALVRAQGAVAAGTKLTVTRGPLCVGDWQYTVLSSPDAEELQVVSRRRGSRLDLVVAGTDVCHAPEVAAAPEGIRDAASC